MGLREWLVMMFQPGVAARYAELEAQTIELQGELRALMHELNDTLAKLATAQAREAKRASRAIREVVEQPETRAPQEQLPWKLAMRRQFPRGPVSQ